MLLQTLGKKEHYFLHTKNLELYLQLSLKVERIYKVVSFKQAKFMEEYINMNTCLRLRGRALLRSCSISSSTMQSMGKPLRTQVSG